MKSKGAVDTLCDVVADKQIQFDAIWWRGRFSL